jgi:hypothetical protein
MDDKCDLLTESEAAVYVAIHGFELWHDLNDYKLPWAVERDNWAQWHWAMALTMGDLDQAMHAAFHDEPGRPSQDFMDTVGVSVIHVPLPTTPQPANRRARANQREYEAGREKRRGK